MAMSYRRFLGSIASITLNFELYLLIDPPSYFNYFFISLAILKSRLVSLANASITYNFELSIEDFASKENRTDVSDPMAKE
mmetsp:Transcript_13941/g.2241  ORF Transcript_13941/g.2241 Transcript_13941/m.2241 type:complete len:81 (+) Transcript_13941:837-1079(+)